MSSAYFNVRDQKWEYKLQCLLLWDIMHISCRKTVWKIKNNFDFLDIRK